MKSSVVMNRSPFFSSVAYFWNTSLNFSVVARLICACGPFYWIEKVKQRKRNETKKMRKWMTKWKRVTKLYKAHSFKCFAELFCAAIISPSNEFRMHSLRVLFLFFFSIKFLKDFISIDLTNDLNGLWMQDFHCNFPFECSLLI